MMEVVLLVFSRVGVGREGEDSSKKESECWGEQERDGLFAVVISCWSAIR